MTRSAVPALCTTLTNAGEASSSNPTFYSYTPNPRFHTIICCGTVCAFHVEDRSLAVVSHRTERGINIWGGVRSRHHLKSLDAAFEFLALLGEAGVISLEVSNMLYCFGENYCLSFE
jgi:hypothetical protein